MAIDAGDNFTRANIVNDWVTLVTQLDSILDAISSAKIRLIDDHTQTEVRSVFAAAAPQGEDIATTNAKADLVRSVAIDLDTLARVSHAQTTVAAANDFFFNARKMTGPRGI